MPVDRKKVGTLSTIDIMRGAAALSVLAYHTLLIFWPTTPPSIFRGSLMELVSSNHPLHVICYFLFGFGFLGVHIFFVVSGFCIHYPYALRQTTPKPRSYLARRVLRIYPPYIIVVIVVFILKVCLAGNAVNPALSGRNFAGHLFFWHYGDGGASSGMGITPVLWTISLEVQFYLLYLVLSFPIKKIGITRIALLWLLADIGYRIAWQLGPFHDILHTVFMPNRFSLIRFGEWLCGAALAELTVRGHIQRFIRGIRLWCVASLSLGCMAGGILFGGLAGYASSYLSMDIPAIAASFCALAIVLSLELRRRLTLSPNNRVVVVLRWAGKRCYSMYLLHFTVLSLAAIAASKFQATRGPKMVLFLLSGVFLSFVAAWLFYAWIELPSHTLARRVGKAVDSPGFQAQQKSIRTTKDKPRWSTCA